MTFRQGHLTNTCETRTSLQVDKLLRLDISFRTFSCIFVSFENLFWKHLYALKILFLLKDQPFYVVKNTCPYLTGFTVQYYSLLDKTCHSKLVYRFILAKYEAFQIAMCKMLITHCKITMLDYLHAQNSFAVAISYKSTLI